MINNFIKFLLSFNAAISNSSSEYKLVSHIKPLVEPTEAKRYALDCVFELIRVIMIISDYLGADALLITIGFHLTGQLAILKCRVGSVLNDTDDIRQSIRKIILGHRRFIR